ncbi:hypothetical protein FGO68_gene9324 [Halteria grandinella]|uniref:Uncharacterized protein n=1 Tax=Halteria grandinella TaxID=5974 RepID=A0A8J8SUE0_HALGN|nr:hypothetical protein FGO68_gene9324 [Halteria grandinella]
MLSICLKSYLYIPCLKWEHQFNQSLTALLYVAYMIFDIYWLSLVSTLYFKSYVGIPLLKLASEDKATDQLEHAQFLLFIILKGLRALEQSLI